MSIIAIWLISIFTSLLLYWLFVEQWGWSVWWVILVGGVMILCGIVWGDRGSGGDYEK